MFYLSRPLPLRLWQTGLLVIILLLCLDNRATVPTSQAQQPPAEELILHLALDHYEMDPRVYRQTAAAMPAEPVAPQSYSTWTKIVFASYHDGNWNIYLSNIDGSNLVILAASGNTEIHPRLNRGGTKVVYATRSNGNYEIALVNPDGTGHQQITSNTTDDVNPVWSANGQKIAFQSYRDGQAEIYVMNANGTSPVRLTNNPAYEGQSAWSPDGAKIAFLPDRSGGSRN